MNKDTKMKWFKDGAEVTQVVYEPSGVGTFTVPQVWASMCTTVFANKEFLIIICADIVTQVTKKEAGVYRAIVADGRGEDESILEFTDNGEKLQFLINT